MLALTCSYAEGERSRSRRSRLRKPLRVVSSPITPEFSDPEWRGVRQRSCPLRSRQTVVSLSSKQVQTTVVPSEGERAPAWPCPRKAGLRQSRAPRPPVHRPPVPGPSPAPVRRALSLTRLPHLVLCYLRLHAAFRGVGVHSSG